MRRPSLPSTIYLVASVVVVGWVLEGGVRVRPLLVPRNDNRALRKERGNTVVLSAGFFSGLVAQSEMDDLLDLLYGSYGERLIVGYKRAS